MAPSISSLQPNSSATTMVHAHPIDPNGSLKIQTFFHVLPNVRSIVYGITLVDEGQEDSRKKIFESARFTSSRTALHMILNREGSVTSQQVPTSASENKIVIKLPQGVHILPKLKTSLLRPDSTKDGLTSRPTWLLTLRLTPTSLIPGAPTPKFPFDPTLVTNTRYLSCKNCRTRITNRVYKTRQLPSHGWDDSLECWMCHTQGGGNAIDGKDGAVERARGLRMNGKTWVDIRGKECWVADGWCSVDQDLLVNVDISSNEKEIYCKACNCKLGYHTKITTHRHIGEDQHEHHKTEHEGETRLCTSFLVHRVDFAVSSSNEDSKPDQEKLEPVEEDHELSSISASVSDVVVQKMMNFADRDAVFKFVIQCDTNEKEVLENQLEQLEISKNQCCDKKKHDKCRMFCWLLGWDTFAGEATQVEKKDVVATPKRIPSFRQNDEPTGNITEYQSRVEYQTKILWTMIPSNPSEQDSTPTTLLQKSVQDGSYETITLENTRDFNTWKETLLKTWDSDAARCSVMDTISRFNATPGDDWKCSWM